MRKMKQLLAVCLAFTVLLTVFTSFGTTVRAAEVIASGGSNPAWTLTDDGVVTISGSGSLYSGPSADYKPQVKKIVVGNGVTYLYSSIFKDCTALEEVEFEEGSALARIGANTFSGCISLTEITLPASLTEINNEAFKDCSALISVTMPDGLTTVRKAAFQNCTSLTELHFPDTITTFGDNMVTGCTSLTKFNIPDGTNNVSSISNVPSLTEIVVGTYNYGFSFAKSIPSLTTVTISEENTRYKSVDGVVYSKDGTSLEFYPMGKIGDDGVLEIPAGVTSIASSACINYSNITTLRIPEGVTTIGTSAFKNCSNLKELYLPKSVTLINGGAFDGDEAIENVYYPGTKNEWRSINIQPPYSIVKSNPSDTETTTWHFEYMPTTVTVRFIVDGIISPAKTVETHTVAVGNAWPVCSILPGSYISLADYASQHVKLVKWNMPESETVEAATDINCEYEAGYHEAVPGSREVVKEPTATEKGIVKYHCAICDFDYYVHSDSLWTVNYYNGDALIYSTVMDNRGDYLKVFDETLKPANYKSEDLMYRYTFSGWDVSYDEENGVATCTAKFRQYQNYVTNIFMDGDTEVDRQLIPMEPGYAYTIPDYMPEIPAPDETYHYSFSRRWYAASYDAPTLTLILRPQFDPEEHDFVYKDNEDGARDQLGTHSYICRDLDCQYIDVSNSGPHTKSARDADESILPTAEENGVDVFHCIDCGAHIEETVPALGWDVTYLDGDGNEIGTAHVANSADRARENAYTGPAPEKQPTEEGRYLYRYTQFEIIREDAAEGTAVAEAQFDTIKNFYTVVYVSDGEELLRQDVIGNADEPTVADPEKASDYDHNYYFNTWIRTVDDENDIVTYTAKFDPKSIFTVTVTIDGTEAEYRLEEGTVIAEAIDVLSTAPAKEATAQYTYTFENWDYEEDIVSKDSTVTAVYSFVVNAYTVTVDVDGVETTFTLPYGTVINADAIALMAADPVKETDDALHYFFEEWVLEEDTVTGNSTVRARFSSKAHEWTCIADDASTHTLHCTVGDTEETKDTAPHKTEILPYQAPSCTQTGLTEGKICPECGYILLAQEEIPMTEHYDGNGDGACDVCGTHVEAGDCSVCPLDGQDHTGEPFGYFIAAWHRIIYMVKKILFAFGLSKVC